MRIRLAIRAAIALSSLAASPALLLARQDKAIPHNQDRPPNPARSPGEAAKSMTVPSGFSVEVVASEPDLLNPVAMTFDERGRIWVTESFEYPRSSPGPGRDRIKVLEDTDSDGVMDKFTVFAEGLNIPSGIAVGGGGVWVANAPDILFLQDTDGDGRADRSEVVVTGFGRDDTHELPNSLTWGPDGWLYGLNGVFNRSVVKHRGKTFDFTCALFRIHPRTREFELFAEGTSNSWGVAWNEQGEAFLSACVIDHLWHLTETGYYHRQGGPYPPYTWKIESIVDYKHQKAAYCGNHYFDSDAYPAEYRDRLYMGNIHGGCINVDGLGRNGSTYRGIKYPDFLTANDAWFMPVAQKTGPDGCLYILDWYDRYHCYQDARRDPEGIDRLKGRLYRVRYKDTPRVHGFDLAKETDDGLIERLHSPNIFFRDLAQRLLRERNDPRTRAKLQALVLRDAAPHKARMHALWALVGADRLDPPFHLALLRHDDPALRAWGVRAAGNMHTVGREVREAVVGLVRDKSPDVSLQVAIASKKIEGVDPIPVLLDAASSCGEDPVIPHIVWQNLHPILDDRRAAEAVVVRVTSEPVDRSEALTRLVPRIVERLLGAKSPPFDLVAGLVLHLAESSHKGGFVAESAHRAIEIVTAKLESGEMNAQGVDGLRARLSGWVRSVTTGPAGHPFFADAALIACAWKDPDAIPAARLLFSDPSMADRDRLRALNALITAGDRTILGQVETIVVGTLGGPIAFRGQVIAGLGRLDERKVADLLIARYAQLEPELRPRVVELLSQRPGWSLAMLRAVESGTISKDSINLNQVRKLLSSKDEAVAVRAKSIWGVVREGRNPQREQVIGRMREFLRTSHGDAGAGAVVFKNVCGQCHKIYGEGQEVGPEITSNGRGSFEQLLSNVFDPSLVIGEAFQATSVSTADGRVLTGLQVENSAQRVVLKTQGGKLETIARENIDELKVSPMSLMPEDLEKQIKPQELADLFAFLVLDRPPSDRSAREIPGTPESLRPAENGQRR